MYSSCILQYGFILWAILAPLALLNINNIQPNSIAEFILNKLNEPCNGVWTQLGLSMRS